jgi:small GTP-binding protein
MTEAVPQVRPPKVVLLGDAGVGKTALIKRQCGEGFTLRIAPTVGNLHHRASVRVGDQVVELQIWDTAGNEQFAPLVPMYARNARAGIIVGAAVEPVSLQNVRVWRDRLLEAESNAFVVLAISKMDLATDPAITTRIQDEFASEFPHIVFTSARSGDGVNELFALVGERVAASVTTESTHGTPGEADGSKCC